MAERYLKLYPYVISVIENATSKQRNGAEKYLLDDTEVEIVKATLEVLAPFKFMTEMLSHSKITNSRVLPTIFYLKAKLQRIETDSELLKQIKSLMMACLDFYIDKYNVLNNVFLIAATYLDPWTKDFQFSQNLSADQPRDYIVKAHAFLKKRDKEIFRQTQSSQKTSNEKRETSHVKTSSNPFEKEFNSFCGRSNAEGEAESEPLVSKLDLECVLYDSIQLKNEVHRSEFWKKYEVKLPRLAKLVRSVCCGPSATIADESIFSEGKNIVRPNRNRLSDKKLEILSFCKKNMDKF